GGDLHNTHFYAQHTLPRTTHTSTHNTHFHAQHTLPRTTHTSTHKHFQYHFCAPDIKTDCTNHRVQMNRVVLKRVQLERTRRHYIIQGCTHMFMSNRAARFLHTAAPSHD